MSNWKLGDLTPYLAAVSQGNLKIYITGSNCLIHSVTWQNFPLTLEKQYQILDKTIKEHLSKQKIPK